MREGTLTVHDAPIYRPTFDISGACDDLSACLGISKQDARKMLLQSLIRWHMAEHGKDETGISIKKLARKAGRVAKKGAHLVVEAHMLPLIIMGKIIVKIGLPIARVICKAPPAILTAGALYAGIDPKIPPLFCKAINARSMKDIKRLLPQAAKLLVALASTGLFPPAVPVLTVIRETPGLNVAIRLIPGLKILAS